MARGSKTKVPVTPTVRRFLHDVFKPGPSLLGKRARDSSPPPPPPHHAHAHHPACVALQNEDHDEDAIIITALSSVPFCCHADLLTMTRPELLSVAHTLNVKLPRLLQIDVAPARSDAAIRCAIERLVGLGVGAGRGQVPPDAPRPARSMRLLEGDVLGRVMQSPGSPLADRSTASVGRASLALAASREEDVEDVLESVDAAPRAGKKRRYNLDACFDAPYFDAPPTRTLVRSQSHRVPPVQVGMTAKVQPARMLRAYSQRLPERRPLMQVPGAQLNVTTTTISVDATTATATRGRAGNSHSGSRELLTRAVASTPKKKRAASALVSCASVSTSTSTSASASSVSTSVAGVVARGARGLKRKASEDSGYAAEVTFGIDGMTMGFATSSSSSSSDMDVGAD